MGYIYRSSITGRFVRACIAKLFPWLTVKEKR